MQAKLFLSMIFLAYLLGIVLAVPVNVANGVPGPA